VFGGGDGGGRIRTMGMGMSSILKNGGRKTMIFVCFCKSVADLIGGQWFLDPGIVEHGK